MYIADILWLPQVIDKLAWKHKVLPGEVNEVLLGEVRYRKVQKGHIPDEDVYAGMDQTDAGRYLTSSLYTKKDEIGNHLFALHVTASTQ